MNAWLWVFGILLGIIALVLTVLFSASVMAILDQPNAATTFVAIVIAAVLFVALVASTVGSYALITSALSW